MSKFLGIFAIIIIIIHCDNTGVDFEYLLNGTKENDSGTEETDPDVISTTSSINALSYRRKENWDPVYAVTLRVLIEETVPSNINFPKYRGRGFRAVGTDLGKNIGDRSTRGGRIGEVPVNTVEEWMISIFSAWEEPSINPILFQAGIIIENLKTYRVRPRRTPFDWRGRDFIFNQTRCDTHLQNRTDSTQMCQASDDFRVGIYPRSSGLLGGGIAAHFPITNAFTIREDTSRNVIAHEIGHIFRLPHINDPRYYPCEWGETYERIMLNTIFVRSFRFIDCEIDVMRKYLARMVRLGKNWVREIRPDEIGDAIRSNTGILDGSPFTMPNELVRELEGSSFSRGQIDIAPSSTSLADPDDSAYQTSEYIGNNYVSPPEEEDYEVCRY